MDAFLRQHQTSCTLKLEDCEFCLFSRWRKDFTWLTCTPRGFGCRACKSHRMARAKLAKGFSAGDIRGAASLRYQKLTRHAASKIYKLAMKNLLVRGKKVPGKDAFRSCIEHLKQGMHSCRALGRIMKCDYHKAAMYKFCVAEGVREGYRAYFKTPGVVTSLSQDAKAPNLSVMFTACNDALARKGGLLRMVDTRPWKDKFAENVANQTLVAILRMCTPCCNSPRYATNRKRDHTSQPDLHLAATVLQSIEVYNADAEGTEQLAGRMLKRRKLDDGFLEEPYLQNLKIVNKDKAHAVRRIPGREFDADPYLAAYHRDVVGSGCFFQRIQHSPALQTVFNDHVRTCGGWWVAGGWLVGAWQQVASMGGMAGCVVCAGGCVAGADGCR